ncbi:hypothetical protein [Brucella lupini]|uniref:Putative transmembrane protein n=1 Tax=Brucella lupini TaxID=255457 RepID=A0A256H0M2_9HYPH|nr:hypothetical protein [Brucella lupini]KAB2699904.1 hypothetical protein F9L03_24850 [Brucella lupini]OYR32973.1 putative transmembrane protein [Brucella lupini]
MLGNFWKKAKQAGHAFQPSTYIFPSLDASKVEADLDIHAEATERGAEEQPDEGAQSLDRKELQIIQVVEDAKNDAYQNLEDQLQSFSQRLTTLDFQGQFSEIELSNANAISSFKAEVVKGKAELHDLRQKLLDATRSYNDFKTKNNITRAPQVTANHMLFLKYAVLLFIFVFEFVGNGYFLAKGNEMGLVGGFIQTMAFAFVNIGFTLFFALICVRRLYLPSIFQKLVGVLSIGLYGCFAVALNLFLAHYREVSGTTFEEAGRAALTQAIANPLGLQDIESWLLFASGLLFSLIAFVDGWSLTDPFPGLAKTYKQMLHARSEYTERQAYLIDELTNVRDDHESNIKEIIESLNERRSQHNEITAHRSKMLSLFITYQEGLERTANALLNTYRDANRKARKTPVPAYFNQPFNLQRVKPTMQASVELTSQEISEAIRKTQTELSTQIKEITQLCSDGIDQYHELDKLFPDEING